jgi:hypothetical protein
MISGCPRLSWVSMRLVNRDRRLSKHDEAPTLIHLDTDIGGDTDDLCALAMLVGWPGVELVGVTTCSDSGGGRAGLATR